MAPSTCRTSPRQPRPMLILREKAFVHWLGRARPGSCITYHVGHLATDRVHELGPLAGPACRELAAVADRAYALAQEGRLLLVQKRHGDGGFSYFAIKPEGHRPREKNPRVDRYIGNRGAAQPKLIGSLHQST